MASTLKINNLDTASGSTLTVNATTTSFPTGKKLIVTDSAGLIAPDMVIQCVTANGSQTNNSSASSWVTLTNPKCDITTKRASSKLVVQLTCAVWRSDSGNYFGVRAYGGPSGSASSRATWGDGYMNGANIAWDTTYQHTYTANSTPGVHENYYQIYPNGASMWFPNNAGAFGSPSHRWSMTVWEIAQ